MQPGWSTPIPQAMQQHGGSPRKKPAPEPKEAAATRMDTASATEALWTRASEPKPEPSF
jgi:hypothetical protein